MFGPLLAEDFAKRVLRHMIVAGTKFPDVTVKLIDENGARDVSTAEILSTGRSIVFSVPGAFTPICSANHLPGFIEAAMQFQNKGIDRIICLAVNDHHVVGAWAKASEALGAVSFIADGTASLAKLLGIDKDMAGTMGVRAVRAAMLVKNGVVEAAFTEDQPGMVTSTGAPAMLRFIE